MSSAEASELSSDLDVTMFGALNRFISRLDAEPTSQQHDIQQQNDTSYGFQILRNENKDIPLEPWFDFIVGINGHGLDSPDHNLFAAEIRNCAGGLCSIDLWSAKGQRTNKLTIPIPPVGQPLGLSLQLAPLNSTQHIWHILNIPSPLSPAHQAGLLPHSDYIIGTPSGMLRGENALGELVEDHLNRSLSLWVYNSEFDVVREVELIPRRGWGGEGALGAILGYGALHKLPVGLGEEVQSPGEDLFDADEKTLSTGPDHQHTAQFLHQEPSISQAVSPPPMINPTAPPPMISPNAPVTGRSAASKKKSRNNAAAKSGFDDMFAEGAKKSAEQDYVSSRKGATVAPPPTKSTTPGPNSENENLRSNEVEADQGGVD